MEISINYLNNNFHLDLQRYYDLSLKLRDKNEDQQTAFGIGKSEFHPFQEGSFIGM